MTAESQELTLYEDCRCLVSLTISERPLDLIFVNSRVGKSCKFQSSGNEMKYEYRANSLTDAVSQVINHKRSTLLTKSSVTIDSGIGGSPNSGTISAQVELGSTYELSWTAEKPVSSGANIYSIKITSFDGHGAYDETFTNGGSWSFIAETTGTIEFAIEITYSGGAAFFSYPVAISIN